MVLWFYLDEISLLSTFRQTRQTIRHTVTSWMAHSKLWASSAAHSMPLSDGLCFVLAPAVVPSLPWPDK